MVGTIPTSIVYDNGTQGFGQAEAATHFLAPRYKKRQKAKGPRRKQPPTFWHPDTWPALSVTAFSSRLLPFAFCLPPSAFRLLPFAFRLLPFAICHLPFPLPHSKIQNF